MVASCPACLLNSPASRSLRKRLLYVSRARFYGIGRAEQHIDSPAVRFPTGKLAAIGSPFFVHFIRYGDATVMLHLEIVVWRIGIDGTPIPELLDELISLLVGTQMQKGATFFRGDDVDGILAQPVASTCWQSADSLPPLLRLLKTTMPLLLRCHSSLCIVRVMAGSRSYILCKNGDFMELGAYQQCNAECEKMRSHFHSGCEERFVVVDLSCQKMVDGFSNLDPNGERFYSS